MIDFNKFGNDSIWVRHDNILVKDYRFRGGVLTIYLNDYFDDLHDFFLKKKDLDFKHVKALILNFFGVCDYVSKKLKKITEELGSEKFHVGQINWGDKTHLINLLNNVSRWIGEETSYARNPKKPLILKGVRFKSKEFDFYDKSYVEEFYEKLTPENYGKTIENYFGKNSPIFGIMLLASEVINKLLKKLENEKVRAELEVVKTIISYNKREFGWADKGISKSFIEKISGTVVRIEEVEELIKKLPGYNQYTVDNTFNLYVKEFKELKNNSLELYYQILQRFEKDDRMPLINSAYINRLHELGIKKIWINKKYAFLEKSYNLYKYSGGTININNSETGDDCGEGMKGGTININNSKTGQLCGFEMKGGTININNSKTGHDCGEGMKGGTINITNSKTGQLCGFEMKDGTINITKSEIGSDCGWGMEGGTINITKSEIGDACGMRMKSGTINITKSETRSYCGFEMKDGTINITNSKTGHDCGEGIKGGTINITKSEIGSDCGMRMKSGTININNSKTGDDCGEGIKGGVILISESEITSFGITLGGCVFYEQQINEYFITNKNLKEKTKNWLIQKNGYKNFLKALKEEIQKNYSSGLLELIKHLKNKNDVYEELTKIMNPNNKEKIIKNYYNEHLRLGYKKFDYNFFKEIGLIKLDSKVIKEKISETENLEKKQKLELLDYYLISLDDKKSYLNNLYKILHAFPNNSDEYYSVNKFFKQLSNLGKDLTRFLSEEITGFWSNSLVLKNMKEIGLNEKAWINYEKINKNSERIVRKSESDLKQILKDYLTDLIPSEVLEKYSDNAGVRDEYYEIKMVFEKTNPEDFKELTTLYTAFNEFWDNHSKKILEKVEEFEKTVKEKVESVNQNLSGKQKQKKIIDLLKEIPEYEIKKQYKKIQHITQNLSIIGEELSTTTQITNTSSRVWRRNSLEDLDTRIPCACIGLRSKFGSEYHVYMWKYHSDLRFFNLDILVGEEPTWKILGFLGMENEKPVLVINSIEGDIVGFDEKLIKQVDEHLKEFMKQLKIKTAYYSTTTHNQPGNKYKEYLKTRYEKTIPTITPILNKHYKHPYFEKDKVYLDFIQTEDFGKEKIKQEFIKIEN